MAYLLPRVADDEIHAKSLGIHERSQLKQFAELFVPAARDSRKIKRAGKRGSILVSGITSVKDRLEAMVVGGFEVVAGGWSQPGGGHAIMYVVERTSETKCVFTVINTGDGIEAHPSANDQFPDPARVRTAISIENVDLARVYDPSTLYMLFQLQSTAKASHHKYAFYGVILPYIAGGSVGEAIQDSSKNGPFRTPQRSGTCYYRCVLATLKYLMFRGGFTEQMQKEVTYCLRLRYLLVALRQLSIGLGLQGAFGLDVPVGGIGASDRIGKGPASGAGAGLENSPRDAASIPAAYADTDADTVPSDAPRITRQMLRDCVPITTGATGRDEDDAEDEEQEGDSEGDSEGDDETEAERSGRPGSSPSVDEGKHSPSTKPQTPSIHVVDHSAAAAGVLRQEKPYSLAPHEVKLLEIGMRQTAVAARKLSIRGWMDTDNQRRVNTLCEEVRRLVVRADDTGAASVSLEDDVLHPSLGSHPSHPPVDEHISLEAWKTAYDPDALLPPPLRLDSIAVRARDFGGFDLLADCRDTDRFQGGASEALPDLFINMEELPPCQPDSTSPSKSSQGAGADESKESDDSQQTSGAGESGGIGGGAHIPLDHDSQPMGGTFDDTEQLIFRTMERVNRLRQRSELGQGSLVFLQLTACVEDAFVRRLPVVQPWAAWMKRPDAPRGAWTPAPGTLNLSRQRKLLQALYMILVNYLAAMRSVQYQRELQGIRVVTSAAIYFGFDWVMRLFAGDRVSPVAARLAAPSKQTEGVIIEKGKNAAASGAASADVLSEDRPAEVAHMDTHVPPSVHTWIPLCSLNGEGLLDMLQHSLVTSPEVAVARAAVLQYDTILGVTAQETAFELHAGKIGNSPSASYAEESSEYYFAKTCMEEYGVLDKLPPGTNRNRQQDGPTPTDLERGIRWLCHDWDEVPELSMLWRASLTARACVAYDPLQNTKTLECRTYYTSELQASLQFQYMRPGESPSALVQFQILGSTRFSPKHGNFQMYVKMAGITEPGAIINQYLEEAVARATTNHQKYTEQQTAMLKQKIRVPATEADVARSPSLPDFDHSLSEEESQLLLQSLAGKYLRIPLVVRFFADDRLGALFNSQLQCVLERVLFEPGTYYDHRPLMETGVVVVGAAPALTDSEQARLGSRYGALMNELQHAPSGIIGPLLTAAHKVAELALGRYTSSFVGTLLFMIRLLSRVEGFLQFSLLNKMSANQPAQREGEKMLSRIRLFMEGPARQKLLRYLSQTEAEDSPEAIVAASKLHAHHALLFSNTDDSTLTTASVGAFMQSVAYVTAWFVQQDADDAQSSEAEEGQTEDALTARAAAYALYRELQRKQKEQVQQLLSQDGSSVSIPISDVIYAMGKKRPAVLQHMRGSSLDERDDILQSMLGTALREPQLVARGWDNASSTAFKCRVDRESLHPYSASTSSYEEFVFPGASSITLTFDDRSETDPEQSGGDFVAIYKDSTYTSTWGKAKYAGEAGDNWPGAGGKPPLVIPSDRCVLHFRSDSDEERWGFRVKIEATIDGEGAVELSKQARTDGIAGTWPLRWCQKAFAEALNDAGDAQAWLELHAGELAAEQASSADEPEESKVNGLFRDGSGAAEVNVQTGEVFLQGRVTAPTPTAVANMSSFKEVFGASVPLCGVQAAKVACQSYNIVTGGHRYVVKSWKPVGGVAQAATQHLPDIFDQPNHPDDAKVPRTLLPPTSHWNAPQLVGSIAVFRDQAFRWSLSADEIKAKLDTEIEQRPGDGHIGHHWAWEVLHESVKEAQEQLRQQRDSREKEEDGRKPEGESADDQHIDTTFFLPYKFVDILQKSVDRKARTNASELSPSEASDDCGTRGLMFIPPNDESRKSGTRPGTWFELQWSCSRCSLSVYQLIEQARRCLRSLVWSSDSRFALRSFESSSMDRSRPWHPFTRHSAGDFFGSSQAKQVESKESNERMFGQAKRLRKIAALKAEQDSKRPASIEIVREPVGRLGGTGVYPIAPETYMNSESLYGLVPHALVESYSFWRHSFNEASTILVGYPRSFELEGTYIRVEIESATGIARIVRLNEAGALSYAQARAPQMGNSETLLNLAAATTGSVLWRFAQLIARAEQLSHVLVWTNATGFVGEEVPMSLVELPRLRTSFQAKEIYDSTSKQRITRLYSKDFNGLYISDERPGFLRRHLRSLPQAIVLSSDIGELSLLAPCLSVTCPSVSSAPFSTELVLNRDDSWRQCLSSRFFVYPLHASGAFLMTPDTSSAMYLAAMCLLRRDYERCCAIAPACRTDLPLNLQEAWALQQLWKSIEDKHPDAHACRIRFAAIEKDAEAEEAGRGPGRQTQDAKAFGLNDWIVADEALKKDFAGYAKKEQSISAYARMSTQEQLDVHRLFEVKGRRTEYLAVLSKVITRQERMDEDAEEAKKMAEGEDEAAVPQLGVIGGVASDEAPPIMVRRSSSLRLERSEKHPISLHKTFESDHPFRYDASDSDSVRADAAPSSSGRSASGSGSGPHSSLRGASAGNATPVDGPEQVVTVQQLGFSTASQLSLRFDERCELPNGVTLRLFLDAVCNDPVMYDSAAIALRGQSLTASSPTKWPGVKRPALVVEQGFVYAQITGPRRVAPVGGAQATSSSTLSWGWAVDLEAEGGAESISTGGDRHDASEAQPVGGRLPSLEGPADRAILEGLASECGTGPEAGSQHSEIAVEHMKAPPPEPGQDTGAYFIQLVEETSKTMKKGQQTGRLTFDKFTVKYRRPSHEKLQKHGWIKLLNEFDDDSPDLSGQKNQLGFGLLYEIGRGDLRFDVLGQRIPMPERKGTGRDPGAVGGETAVPGQHDTSRDAEIAQRLAAGLPIDDIVGGGATSADDNDEDESAIDFFEDDFGAHAQPTLLHMLSFVYAWNFAKWDLHKGVNPKSSLGMAFGCLGMLAKAGDIDRVRGMVGKPGSLVSLFPPLPLQGNVREFQMGVNFSAGIGFEFTSKLGVACEATSASMGYRLARIYRQPRTQNRRSQADQINVAVRAADSAPSRPSVQEFGCNHRELRAMESDDSLAPIHHSDVEGLPDLLDTIQSSAGGGRFGLGLSPTELRTFSRAPLQGFGFGIGGASDVEHPEAAADLVQRPAEGNSEHKNGPLSGDLPFSIDRNSGDASTFEGKEILDRIEADMRGSAEHAQTRLEWRLSCLDDEQMHVLENALLDELPRIDEASTGQSMRLSQPSSSRGPNMEGTGFESPTACAVVKNAAETIRSICIRLERVALEDKIRVSTGISKLLSGANKLSSGLTSDSSVATESKHSLQHSLRRSAGAALYLWFEFFAASTMSKGAIRGIRRLNPFMTPQDCEMALQVTAAIMLRVNRIVHVARSLESAKNLLRQLEGLVVQRITSGLEARAVEGSLPPTRQVVSDALKYVKYDPGAASDMVAAALSAADRLAIWVNSMAEEQVEELRATDSFKNAPLDEQSLVRPCESESEARILAMTAMHMCGLFVETEETDVDHVATVETAARRLIEGSTPDQVPVGLMHSNLAGVAAVRKIVSLQSRGCCLHGSRLKIVPDPVGHLDSNTIRNKLAAALRSLPAQIYLLRHKATQVAQLMAVQRHYMDGFAWGGGQMPSSSEAVPFDPRFLGFEFMSTFVLRRRQVQLVRSFVQSASSSGGQRIEQQLMGGGKSSVLMPLAALCLADGESLVMSVMPTPLLQQSKETLRQVFSALVVKRIVTLRFDRAASEYLQVSQSKGGAQAQPVALQAPARLDALVRRLDRARRDGAIVCSTPDAIKSLMLKYIEFLSEVESAPPKAFVDAKRIIDRQEREAAVYAAKTTRIYEECADALRDLMRLWGPEGRGVVLLDEVDLILHSLKSETNFPIGGKFSVDLGIPDEAEKEDLELEMALYESGQDTESPKAKKKEIKPVASAAASADPMSTTSEPHKPSAAELAQAAAAFPSALQDAPGDMWPTADDTAPADFEFSVQQDQPQTGFGLPVEQDQPQTGFGLPVLQDQPQTGFGLPVQQDQPQTGFGLPVENIAGTNTQALSGTLTTPIASQTLNTTDATDTGSIASSIDQPQLSWRPSRWDLPFHLLEAILAHTRGRVRLPGFHPTTESTQILGSISEAIDAGVASLAIQTSPHLVLLRPEYYHGKMRGLLARWLRLWLREDPFLRRAMLPMHDPATGMPVSSDEYSDLDRVKASSMRFSEELETAILDFIQGASMGSRQQSSAAAGAGELDTDLSADAHPSVRLLHERCSELPSALKVLHLARQWIATYLPHVLSKINRVSFGLLRPSDLAKTAGGGVSMPVSRKLLSVPFVGKDQPSSASEFAQVDTQIGLAILAYRYEGMRRTDLDRVLRRLKADFKSENGPAESRPSRMLFQSWIDAAAAEFYKAQQTACGTGAGNGKGAAQSHGSTEKSSTDTIAPAMEVLPLELLQPREKPHVDKCFEALQTSPEMIVYYLRKHVFPEVMRHRRVKIMASGVDIAGRQMLFDRRLGFSGTPSSTSLLPTGMHCEFEKGSEALIIRTLTKPRLVSTRLLSKSWTVDVVLRHIAKSLSPRYSALIDAGALVTGLSNLQVAERLLQFGLMGSKGVVFLDDNDDKMILMRASGRVVPLANSGVPPEQRFAFYDQIHCTGVDLKLPLDAIAAVTVGKSMTLRDYSQACWRCRGLETGQTLVVLLIPEVVELVRRSANAEAVGTTSASGHSSLDDSGVGDGSLVGPTRLSSDLVSWLAMNGIRSEQLQHLQACQQNLSFVWRKEAIDRLRLSSTPELSKPTELITRFVRSSLHAASTLPAGYLRTASEAARSTSVDPSQPPSGFPPANQQGGGIDMSNITFEQLQMLAASGQISEAQLMDAVQQISMRQATAVSVEREGEGATGAEQASVRAGSRSAGASESKESSAESSSPLASSAVVSLRDSVAVFREPMIFDVPRTMEPPRMYHEVLGAQLQERKHLLDGPRQPELEAIGRDILAECEKAESDAMRARQPANQTKGTGESEEQGSGLSAAEELSFDAEVVQEQEQEQEQQQEQEIISVRSSGPVGGQVLQWTIGAMRSPDSLRRQAFYLLQEYRPIETVHPIQFPADVFLTSNLAPKVPPAGSDPYRLANALVLAEWTPAGDQMTNGAPPVPRVVLLTLAEASAVRKALHTKHPALFGADHEGNTAASQHRARVVLRLLDGAYLDPGVRTVSGVAGTSEDSTADSLGAVSVAGGYSSVPDGGIIPSLALARQAARFFNCEFMYSDRELVALVRALRDSPLGERRKFMRAMLDGARRRDRSSWAETPLAEAMVHPDEVQLMKLQAIARRIAGQVSSKVGSVAKAFQEMDGDGDGYVTEDEMMTGLRRLGVEVVADDVRAILRASDTNGDGYLDLREFARKFAPREPSKHFTSDDIDQLRSGDEDRAGERIRATLARDLLSQDEARRLATEQYMKEHSEDSGRRGLGAVISTAISSDQQEAAVTAGSAGDGGTGMGFISDHLQAADVVRLGQFVVTSGGAALLEGGNFARVTSGTLVSLRSYGVALPTGAKQAVAGGFGSLPLAFYVEATILTDGADTASPSADDQTCIGVCAKGFKGSNKKQLGVGSGDASWGLALDGTLRSGGQNFASSVSNRLRVGDVIGIMADTRRFESSGACVSIFLNGELVVRRDSDSGGDRELATFTNVAAGYPREGLAPAFSMRMGSQVYFNVGYEPFRRFPPAGSLSFKRFIQRSQEMRVLRDAGRAAGKILPTSGSGQISINGLDVKWIAQFPSAVLAGCLLTSGKWYFEMQCKQVGSYSQLGWADMAFFGSSQGGEGVGDDKCSWAYDGERAPMEGKWHAKSSHAYGKKWAAGDYVGFAVDMDRRTMQFGLNGRFDSPMGVAFQDFMVDTGLTPAVTPSRSAWTLNLGATPFGATPPAGYRSIQSWFAERDPARYTAIDFPPPAVSFAEDRAQEAFASSGSGEAAALPSSSLEAVLLVRGVSTLDTPSSPSADGPIRALVNGFEVASLDIHTQTFKALRHSPTAFADGVRLASGRWYYEVRILNAGMGCIGWSDLRFFGRWAKDEGVGDDPEGHSWGFDGFKGCIRHAGQVWPFPLKWRQGDVVGCAVDLNTGAISFAVNGAWGRAPLAFGSAAAGDAVCRDAVLVQDAIQSGGVALRPSVTSDFSQKQLFEVQLLFNEIGDREPPEGDGDPYLPLSLSAGNADDIAIGGDSSV